MGRKEGVEVLDRSCNQVQSALQVKVRGKTRNSDRRWGLGCAAAHVAAERSAWEPSQDPLKAADRPGNGAKL